MNCTYPDYYWQDHPELYPPQLVWESKIYQANEIQGVLSESEHSLAAKVRAQLLAAYLNISAGADQSVIKTTIFQAYGWVELHPDDKPVSESEQRAGSQLANVLEAYNLGLIGVPACKEVPTDVPTATATPTITPSMTPTNTSTRTITATPTGSTAPTLQQKTPTPTFYVPTRRPTATTEAPREPAPTRTPEDTNTPKPPQATPEPTDTQEVEPPTLTPPIMPTFTPPSP
jgi:hypothetical protein